MKTYKNIQISNIFKERNENKKTSKLLIFYFTLRTEKNKKVFKNMLTFKTISSIIKNVPIKNKSTLKNKQ